MDVKAILGLRGFYLLMSSILKQKIFFYVYNYFPQLRKIVSGSGQGKKRFCCKFDIGGGCG